MEQQLALNSSFGGIAGGTSAGNLSAGGDYSYWYQPAVYQPIIREYYPYFQTAWTEKSKIEQSFKIVQKLIDKKVIEIKTVKQFIETINDVVEVL